MPLKATTNVNLEIILPMQKSYKINERIFLQALLPTLELFNGKEFDSLVIKIVVQGYKIDLTHLYEKVTKP